MAKQKIWHYRTHDADRALKARLEQQCELSPLFIDLLLERGLDSQQSIAAFFAPSLEDLHDPFLMKNMEQAVERLTLALEREERVLVYGDYDVDGTTSVSLIYRYLGELGVDVGI